jgi:hypothetical protein
MDLDGGTHTINIISNNIGTTGFSSPAIYVNGQQTSAVTQNIWQHVVINTGTSFSATALTVAKRSSTYFTGSLDELSFYDQELPSAQIRRLYNSNSGISIGSMSVGSTNVPLNGLINWWRFDESVGTTAIDSIGNTTATLVSNPTRVSGKFGNALYFDGSSSYVDTTITTILTNDFTYSFWIKPDRTQVAYADIFGNHINADGIVMQQSGSSTNIFGAPGSGTQTFTLIPDVWQFVVFSKSSTQGTRVWVNNKLVLSNAYLTALTQNSSYTLKIGQGYQSGGRYFHGDIDEFNKFYNRVLTPIRNYFRILPGDSPYSHISPSMEFRGHSTYDQFGHNPPSYEPIHWGWVDDGQLAGSRQLQTLLILQITATLAGSTLPTNGIGGHTGNSIHFFCTR